MNRRARRGYAQDALVVLLVSVIYGAFTLYFFSFYEPIGAPSDTHPWVFEGAQFDQRWLDLRGR